MELGVVQLAFALQLLVSSQMISLVVLVVSPLQVDVVELMAVTAM
jgi:hypothetical protein